MPKSLNSAIQGRNQRIIPTNICNCKIFTNRYGVTTIIKTKKFVRGFSYETTTESPPHVTGFEEIQKTRN